MPADWRPRCEAANLFYYNPSSHSGVGLGGGVIMPELGNGYIGTIAKSDTIFAGGLFNGDATGMLTPNQSLSLALTPNQCLNLTVNLHISLTVSTE